MGGPGEEEARSLEGSPLVVGGPGEEEAQSLERSPQVVGGPGEGGARSLEESPLAECLTDEEAGCLTRSLPGSGRA